MNKCILLLVLTAATWCSAQTNSIVTDASPDISPAERIEMLQRVGEIYYQEGDWDNALDAFQRILKIDPDQKETRSLIGVIYFSTSRYKEAIENISALVEDYPEDYQIINNLAWVYATSKESAYRDAQKAIDLAQQALVLAPYDHHIWSTLSEAYYVAGEYEKANRAIRHLVALATSSSTKMTETMIQTYNDQIKKCSRAIEAEKLLREDQ
jgi:tetratricopeptide (TPR) repeat protein